MVVRLHVGDVHADGLGEGPWVVVTPVEAIRALKKILVIVIVPNSQSVLKREIGKCAS